MTTTLQRSAVLAACADMIRACGLTLAELAAELAQPDQADKPLRMLPMAGEVDIDAVHHRAAPVLAQRKTPALSQQALQVLAYCDQPKGAIMKQVADMLGVDYSTGAHHCEKLARARLLQKVKAPGEHAFRYWTQQAHATAYVEARTAELRQQKDAEQRAQEQRQRDAQDRQRQAAERQAARAQQRQEREARAAAPKLAKKAKPLPHQALTITPPKPPADDVRPRGEAITTEKTVETRDTTVRPNAKWQLQQLPPDPRWPRFSSVPPGCDPRTGQPWERRA